MNTDFEHYTANGVGIQQGLRVFTNECKWGTIGAHLFDGWYDVHYDDGGKVMMNGERISTRGLR